MRNAVATQSTTHKGVASLAIDGNLGQTFYDSDGRPQCTHTIGAGYWQLYLDHRYFIKKVYNMNNFFHFFHLLKRKLYLQMDKFT